MILPQNSDKLSYEELVEELVSTGYTQEAAEYIAGKVKGKIKDDNILM